MKTLLLLVSCFHLTGFAQTNSTSSCRDLLSAPGCHLRLPAPSDERIQPSPPATIPRETSSAQRTQLPLGTNSTSDNSFEKSSLSSRLNNFDLQIYDRLERDGYLTRPELPSDNHLLRFLNETFEPEVIHWRKMSISSPLITAAKRKNPFCLLNPIFLDVRW